MTSAHIAHEHAQPAHYHAISKLHVTQQVRSTDPKAHRMNHRRA